MPTPAANPIADALRAVVARTDLSSDQAAQVAAQIVRGEATPAQIGGLLIALRMKGETVDEISGFVRAIRAAATPVTLRSQDAIDTCGTGGDGSGTFNVSTVAAFVAAGAGCRVAKHGNRASSSACGSADVLDALGVNTTMPPEHSARCVDEIGIGFFFAPQYHPGARHAREIRREIGVRSIFNLIGPLVHPAGVRRQLMGVYDPRLTDVAASVLSRHGVTRAWVVHSEDGMDEISLAAPTQVSELRDGSVTRRTVTPEDFGVPRQPASAQLAGGDAAYNAAIVLEVLRGERGPRRDIVILNAAAAVLVAGWAPDVRRGAELAEQSIDSGRALAALQELRRRSIHATQEHA